MIRHGKGGNVPSKADAQMTNDEGQMPKYAQIPKCLMHSNGAGFRAWALGIPSDFVICPSSLPFIFSLADPFQDRKPSFLCIRNRSLPGRIKGRKHLSYRLFASRAFG